MGTDFGNGTGVVGNSKEGNGIYGTTPNSGMSGVVGGKHRRREWGSTERASAVTPWLARAKRAMQAGSRAAAPETVFMGKARPGNGVQGTTGDSNSSGVVGVNTGGGNSGFTERVVSGNCRGYGHSQTSAMQAEFDGGV